MYPKSKAQTDKLVKRLFMIVIAMFGFAFLLIPFYNVFCKVTGLNGKTALNDRIEAGDDIEDIEDLNAASDALIMPIDTSRFVKIQLVANRDAKLQAEFVPQHKQFTFHPGEFVKTNFRVKNLTNKPMTIQAIPSVSPGQGAKHVKKVVCFCFQQQELAANEEMIMPLRFTVDAQLPARYKTITLAYTLFDVTQAQ